MAIYLITRPLSEAQELAVELAARGLGSLIEPLLAIETITENLPNLAFALARKPQAILLTSRHALQALAECSPARDIPLLVVGGATARHAESLGFAVTTYGETAQELAALVASHCTRDTPLLYARGEIVGTDLAGLLSGTGYVTDCVTLYRAIPATTFSETLQTALTQGTLAGALFFSQRTAETYTALAHRHGLTQTHTTLTALALSDAIAVKLSPLPWKAVRIAGVPDREHLLELAEAPK